MKFRKLISQIALLSYLTMLLAASLWPTPVDGGGVVWFITSQILQFARGVQWLNWLQYNQLEALANVVLYMPLGIFLVIFLPRVKIIPLCLIPIIFSSSVEAAQRFLLPERYSTLNDVLNNALGGLLGVLIAAGIRRLMRRRASER